MQWSPSHHTQHILAKWQISPTGLIRVVDSIFTDVSSWKIAVSVMDHNQSAEEKRLEWTTIGIWHCWLENSVCGDYRRFYLVSLQQKTTGCIKKAMCIRLCDKLFCHTSVTSIQVFDKTFSHNSKWEQSIKSQFTKIDDHCKQQQAK